MSNQDIDFVKGYAQQGEHKKEQDLSLCYAYPVLTKAENSDVFIKNNKNHRELTEETILVEDGLYVCDNPFVYGDFKPSQYANMKILEYETKRKFCGKLVEIVIREVNIHTVGDQSDAVQITSVWLLFKNKLICKTKSPFNRRLHKLLIKYSECNNLSIQVHAKGGESSILPLPLPKHNVENNITEVDFAIGDGCGKIHGGTVTCTISLNNYGADERKPEPTYLYKLSSDPNDPQNYLCLLRPSKTVCKKEVNYFSLQHSALTLGDHSETTVSKEVQVEEIKAPDIVIKELPVSSLFDLLSISNLFQSKQSFESSFSTRRHHTIGKTVLVVTILRGIEIPIREESALVQPFVEVEWSNTNHVTSIAEGPAPIWQQTMHFELPRQTDEYCIKIRLYDQHPVWGQQWLGEARIPLEHHRNYQELERWIVLSPLYSPSLLFGYVQASPGQSHTRIYVLIKMEQCGTPKSIESSTIPTLLKGIQRCLVTPYKINGLEDPKDVARLVMLLPLLPTHYGPVTPRQALNIKKVDHYGRAALLAALLRGFNMHAYVLLGASQIKRWTAFVLSKDDSGMYLLWDPEIGNCYRLDDSHCPLMKVSRLINHFGAWENLQKSILPHNLKYDVGSSKEWKPIDSSTLLKSEHTVQSLELHITDEEIKQIKKKAVEIEQQLKDKLSDWRSTIGLTTIFNRHAMTILRSFISKIEPSSKPQLDKRDLKQLYRAYHVHGFILNKRECLADELVEQLHATKIHNITGPIEFGIVCHVQSYVGKICSTWLAVIILRSRD